LLDELLVVDHLSLRLLHQQIRLVDIGDSALTSLIFERVDSQDVLIGGNSLL